MDFDIKDKRVKSKIIGVRLYEEEYDFISDIAAKKKLSRSFVAESIVRTAIFPKLKSWKRPRHHSHSKTLSLTE